MAVFVLGAGATRGASFVDPSKNACLPPLDTDFYAQLQRIRTKKHERIIKNVIQDTVDLFGVNFNVTMETVFTTLEHILRMVHTTGESRDFKRDEIGEKQGRLMQSIAATLEEALCPEGYEGTKCVFHAKLVEALKAEDEIISFNYDCLIEAIDATSLECSLWLRIQHRPTRGKFIWRRSLDAKIASKQI
jgi:hypothetical protein